MRKLILILLLAVCTIASKCNCSNDYSNGVDCDPSCSPDSCQYWSNCTSSSSDNDSSNGWIGGILALATGVVIFLCCCCCCWKMIARINKYRNEWENNWANENGNPRSHSSDSEVLLTQSMINNHVQVEYYGDSVEFKGQSVCSVCLADFKTGEAIRVTSCKHIYHVACLDAWLLTCHRAKCPNCNLIIIEQ